MSENICPICHNETEDMRHVDVECFYDVNEVAPGVEKRMIFREVPEKGSYFGITRRYPPGTRDNFNPVKTGPDSYRIDNAPEPTPAIRLLEEQIFSMTCCKSCRGDFLTMFGSWARGELVAPAEPMEDADITGQALRGTSPSIG